MDLDDELRQLTEGHLMRDSKLFRVEMDGEDPVFIARVTVADLRTAVSLVAIAFLYLCAMRGIARG